MSKTPAQWDALKRAISIRDCRKSETLIFGNGDIMSLEQARVQARVTGADGIMIGRAIFGNPWFFSGTDRKDLSAKTRLLILLEHTLLFKKLFSNKLKKILLF
jgi:tRNA-dihydrouridine synthase